MKTKQDAINYVSEQLKGMRMTLMLTDCPSINGKFIYNKYDRSRAHVKLNPNIYTTDEFIAIALHELGHARMFVKYSIREYISRSNDWHEIGAWDIALHESEKLGIKLNAETIIRGLSSHKVGIEHIERLMHKWNHCLYSVSFA